MSKLAAPRGLGGSGAALWRRIVGMKGPDGSPLVLSEAEQVALELAAHQADDLAALEAALADEGLIVVGSKGQSRLSALPTEIRLQRAALARLIDSIALPEVDGEEGLSPSEKKARRAAQARWRRREQQRAQLRSVGR